MVDIYPMAKSCKIIYNFEILAKNSSLSLHSIEEESGSQPWGEKSSGASSEGVSCLDRSLKH